MKSNSFYFITIIFLICFFLGSVNLFAESDYWNEVKKIMADDVLSSNNFGNSVAVAGNFAVVGSERENTGGEDAGAAYIFEKNSGNPNAWKQIEKLKASNLQDNNFFGHAVAIDGNTIVVGAYLEDTDRVNTGAAYVFERNIESNAWMEIKKLRASDAGAGDSFGCSVAIADDVIVIGAEGNGVGGAAYIFERNSGGTNNWGEVKQLTALGESNNYYFGIAVDVDGDIVVVGANEGSQAGTAYVFGRNSGGTNTWGRQKKLLASDIESYDSFGSAVAIARDVIVVGAWGEDSAAIGAGAAYIFEKNIGGINNWGELKKIVASDARAESQFGVSVAIYGDTAVIGAWADSKVARWAGAAYIFDRNCGGSNNWNETKKIIPSDLQKEDNFGYSVAIANDVIAVGSLHEDSGGINAGAAYVFSLYGHSPSEIFTNAPPLSNDSGIASGNNTNAVTEPGEPAHADNGGPYHSVWWDWSATSNALMLETTTTFFLQADTHGSDFDTVLAVYTGSAVNNLTQIATNDNAEAGIETSELSFQFNPGVTYHIVVDGKTASDTGNVVLNYAVIPEPLLFINCYLLFIIYYRRKSFRIL